MSNNWQNTQRKRSHTSPEGEPSRIINSGMIMTFYIQGGTGYAGSGVELKATKAGAAMMV